MSHRYTRDELIELIFSLFNQACRQENLNRKGEPQVLYDHMFLSTYKEAQEVLLQEGIIEPKNCVRK